MGSITIDPFISDEPDEAGRVCVIVDGEGTEYLTPAEARALAVRLIATSHEADAAIRRTIVAEHLPTDPPERISYGELAELQDDLAPKIDPGDVELLETAGVPEFPADDTDEPLCVHGLLLPHCNREAVSAADWNAGYRGD